MSNQDQISDDPGTILDSFENISKVLKANVAGAALRPGHLAAKPVQLASCDEVVYRSPYRPTAPRLTICDDGTLEDGEVIYLRADRMVIGRAKGDILIAHDVAMSASHAEMARTDIGGTYGWQLRDLGSSNGTFVRCRTVTLRPGLILLIGSKRYRFDLPTAATAAPETGEEEPKTALVTGPAAAAALPALVELSPNNDSSPARFPFRSLRATIGRPGFGNDIEFDDLCVAKMHAIVTRDTSGAWLMQSQPSLNGVWVKVNAVKLTDGCLFQCGEQRFRFHF